MSPSLAIVRDDGSAPPARRILRTNWGLLAAAFSDDTAGVRWYVHAETGEIVRVTEIERPPSSFLEAGYVPIERARAKEQYRWMERYIASLTDRDLAAELSNAILGKRAFQRFKTALAAHPGQSDDWYAFRGRELARAMRAWLSANGLVVPRHAPTPALLLVPRQPEETESEQRGQLDALIEELEYDELRSLLALAELLAQRASCAESAPMSSPRKLAGHEGYTGENEFLGEMADPL